MKLIILLACVLLQTFNIRLFHDRYRLFDQYYAFIKPLLAKLGVDRGWIGIIGVLAPLLIVILILNSIFSHFAILYFLYGVLILLICLDVRDVKANLATFFNALSSDDRIHAQVEVEKFTHLPADEDKSSMIRAVTGAILLQSITNIFAVIFWFLVFGPLGAVFYYLVAAMSEQSVKEPSEGKDYSQAKGLKDVLDWLPVRLVAFTYALVGNFAPIFNLWVDRLGEGISSNASLLIDSGMMAMDLPEDSHIAEVGENHKAAALVRRTLWTWMIAITVFYVIGWIF